MYNKPTNAEEMEEFERMTTGFDYVYEDTVGAGVTLPAERVS